LRATAVAAFHSRFAQFAARVSRTRKGQRTGEECQIEDGPDGEAPKPAEKGSRHIDRVSRRIEKKPIALSY
jgi:hypothetical protein